MQQFTPPVLTGSASQVPRVLLDTTGPARALYSRVRPVDSSKSLLVTGGVYTEVINPSQDQIDAADEYYQGGRLYVVSDATATALSVAGYGSGLSAYTPPAATVDSATAAEPAYVPPAPTPAPTPLTSLPQES